jgi:hypothetical protein
MLFQHRLVAALRDGMEVEIEALAARAKSPFLRA